jgi:hypothetical protein
MWTHDRFSVCLNCHGRSNRNYKFELRGCVIKRACVFLHLPVVSTCRHLRHWWFCAVRGGTFSGRRCRVLPGWPAVGDPCMWWLVAGSTLPANTFHGTASHPPCQSSWLPRGRIDHDAGGLGRGCGDLGHGGRGHDCDHGCGSGCGTGPRIMFGHRHSRATKVLGPAGPTIYVLGSAFAGNQSCQGPRVLQFMFGIGIGGQPKF